MDTTATTVEKRNDQFFKAFLNASLQSPSPGNWKDAKEQAKQTLLDEQNNKPNSEKVTNDPPTKMGTSATSVTAVEKPNYSEANLFLNALLDVRRHPPSGKCDQNSDTKELAIRILRLEQARLNEQQVTKAPDEKVCQENAPSVVREVVACISDWSDDECDATK